ncbi:uncharacterized protein LOC117900797 [Drosophila subobscura]|uniref:uncharacterized protein LOC117900797 n=1 Tax=Drosophila subobscura TaxID=7241 RepID=UPI00155A5FA8|nr:uncharacterized protein LOC117900797 [Drosophila subobscura]
MKKNIVCLLGAFVLVIGVSASPNNISQRTYNPEQFALGMNVANPRRILALREEGKALREIEYQRRLDRAKEGFKNLQPELKMYFALSQQIQLDQETVDKEIAKNQVALEMAAKQLAEIREKLLEAKRECPPDQPANREPKPSYQLDRNWQPIRRIRPGLVAVPHNPNWRPNRGIRLGINRVPYNPNWRPNRGMDRDNPYWRP